MIEGVPAPPASIGYEPETMQNISEAACSWTLVERTADNAIEDGLSDLLSRASATNPGRVQASQPVDD